MGGKEKQWFYRPDEHKSYWNREEEHTIEEIRAKYGTTGRAQGDRIGNAWKPERNQNGARSPDIITSRLLGHRTQKDGNSNHVAKGKQMNSFEQYHPVFEVVCRILGNGWRVNKLDDCSSRIKRRHRSLKLLCMHIRMGKDRFSVVGSVDSRSWRSPHHVCRTLSRNGIPLILQPISKAKNSGKCFAGGVTGD